MLPWPCAVPVRVRFGGSSAAGCNDGKIHVLVYGDAANKVEKQLIATFNKQSKLKAVLDTIPGADYQAKLQTMTKTASRRPTRSSTGAVAASSRSSTRTC